MSWGGQCRAANAPKHGECARRGPLCTCRACDTELGWCALVNRRGARRGLAWSQLDTGGSEIQARYRGGKPGSLVIGRTCSGQPL
jgi:hypothetical protein